MNLDYFGQQWAGIRLKNKGSILKEVINKKLFKTVLGIKGPMVCKKNVIVRIKSDIS